MSADVRSLLRLLNGYKNDHAAAKESTGAKSSAELMTRDLLGGDRSLELDLDLQVPTGWEKRLDLKSGKIYLQRCDSMSSSSSITNSDQSNQTVPNFQDLNFPPISPANKPLLNLFDDTCPPPGMKLTPSFSNSRPLSISPNRNFHSVCTLEKVKSALERAERDKKRQSPEVTMTAEEIASPVAAGCSGCLSYVLVMKNDPKCPRCDTIVSLPGNYMKKPKIDLNISI
ncbi:unnamed protein product [Cochlearia groenlandica]